MNYEKWAFHDVSPVSAQLKQKLMYSILSGKLSAGDKIPSVREMAELIHINPNTVVKAYKAVKQEELIICSNSKLYQFNALQTRLSLEGFLCVGQTRPPRCSSEAAAIYKAPHISEDKLLSLYNAVNKSNYTNPDDLEIVTLENAVYMNMKNDLYTTVVGILQQDSRTY